MEPMRLLRADQVGSLLRPQALLDARAASQAGRLSEAELVILRTRRSWPRCGRERGAPANFVDGEFRRTGFMTGFPDAVEGFVPDAYVPIAWKGGTGAEGASPNTQLVIGQRLRSKKRIAKNEADFLKQHAPGPFKASQFRLVSPAINIAYCLRRRCGRAEHRGRGRLPIGVGQVDQGGIALAPLKAVLQLADFPAVVGAAKGILVPAILCVVVVAMPVREPMPRHMIENSVSLIATQIDVEVGILMHDNQPLKAGAGKSCPNFRSGVCRRAAGQIEKIHLEGIGERCRVHVPVMQVQPTSETEHNVADLLPVPQLANDLVGAEGLSG